MRRHSSRKSAHTAPRLSVVIPVFNEAGNITPLAKAISRVFARRTIEIIMVNDASRDASARELKKLAREIPALRVLTHSVRSGQSAALRHGIMAARSDTIATLDGDGQNPPEDLIALESRYRKTKQKNPARPVMVAGYRVRRQDGFAKRAASRFARRVRRILLADSHPDTGCATKVFDRALYLRLPYFNHMHRFLAPLARREGARVIAMPVGHAPRLKGASKYRTLDRLAVGISDILGVVWLMRRGVARTKVKELRQ